jgi:hypothetical protein
MRKLQKQVEKSQVRYFLENVLGLSVRRLLGRNPPRPDIYSVVERNGGTAILEIELVEYQVDTSSGQENGSPGERLNSFWRKVQDSLCRRMSKKPVKVDVRVTLKDASTVKNQKARGFAEELVRLAFGFDFSASDAASLTTFQPEFPLLAQYVRTLTLTKVSFCSIGWTCTDASVANVGVSPKHVASLVRNKGNKTYTWAKNAEKWLLVCASGRTIVGRAGAPPTPATWQDPGLKAACIASPFDRVHFCDLPGRWHKCLK